MTRRMATVAFLASISEALGTVAWFMLGRLSSWQSVTPLMQWCRWGYSCGVTVVLTRWAYSAATRIPTDERDRVGSGVAAAIVEGFFIPLANLWLGPRAVLQVLASSDRSRIGSCDRVLWCLWSVTWIVAQASLAIAAYRLLALTHPHFWFRRPPQLATLGLAPCEIFTSVIIWRVGWAGVATKCGCDVGEGIHFRRW